ncbi:hypothetical protein [Krasilnikovia sp. M28-CT-15]|uniref:hypothetical protein n=1 Tax=Krasilnikovia sp. M28-CT-15 TaxID=3373540 RepID=UPI003876806F
MTALNTFDALSSGDVGGDRNTVVAVRNGERTIGAYVVRHGSIVFVPAVDVTRLVLGSVACAAGAAVATAFAASRRRPAIGSVSMGPGGWVSLKNAAAPALRPGSGRPWWARMLGAHRLVVEDH